MAVSCAAFEGLLKRDRAIVLGALALVVALAWADMAWMVLEMGEDASGPFTSWNAGYFAAMLAMWAIMMAGMMMPSAAPAILLFAALRRHAGRPSTGPALVFAGGYLAAWTAFSLVATVVQWRLAAVGLVTPEMTSASAPLSGALFVAAGLYQLSPFKDACLAQCRSPARFLTERRREGRWGPLVMGMDHGAYCIGCCWAVMALLFAFGVMNLLWVAAIAAFVLAEKVLPAGRGIARAGGVAMVALGLLLFNA